MTSTYDINIIALIQSSIDSNHSFYIYFRCLRFCLSHKKTSLHQFPCLRKILRAYNNNAHAGNKKSVDLLAWNIRLALKRNTGLLSLYYCCIAPSFLSPFSDIYIHRIVTHSQNTLYALESAVTGLLWGDGKRSATRLHWQSS